MNRNLLILLAVALLSGMAGAQTGTSDTVAPGESLPGLKGIPIRLDGPGYIEAGGSHSALTGGNSNWNDFYLRGMLSGGRNSFAVELNHESRFGDNGWFGGFGLTRTLSEDWYAQISAGASAGGFFLPRYRTDVLMNRKLLSKRQLVATFGFGFDQSRTVNHDERFQIEGAYYFQQLFVLQGGVLWTHANPGNILAQTQFVALNEGHDKEHFLSLRFAWGREGYEVIGAPTVLVPAYNVLFNFPEHDITGTWRQWIGPNWGVSLVMEQHQEPTYHRIGGTAGVFLDF